MTDPVTPREIAEAIAAAMKDPARVELARQMVASRETRPANPPLVTAILDAAAHSVRRRSRPLGRFPGPAAYEGEPLRSRALDAARLRSRGLSYGEIGDRLNVTRERARQIVVRGREVRRHAQRGDQARAVTPNDLFDVTVRCLILHRWVADACVDHHPGAAVEVPE